jgi:hypothetical protein
METFSFVDVREAKPCEERRESTSIMHRVSCPCGKLTRIRIEDIPICSDHMEKRLKSNATYRLVQITRAERDRRRAKRRLGPMGRRDSQRRMG